MKVLALIGVLIIGSVAGYALAILIDTIHRRILRKQHERNRIWDELNR